MNFQKLIVQADPIHAGKHPYHDNRYITTNHRLEAEQPFSIGGSGYDAPEIRFVEGDGEEMIVAEMRDCRNQAEYARLFAAAPELLSAAKKISAMIGDVSDKSLWPNVGPVADELRQAIALAEGNAVIVSDENKDLEREKKILELAIATFDPPSHWLATWASGGADELPNTTKGNTKLWEIEEILWCDKHRTRIAMMFGSTDIGAVTGWKRVSVRH